MTTFHRRALLLGASAAMLGCKTTRTLRRRLQAQLDRYQAGNPDRVLPPDDGVPVPWQGGQYVVIAQRYKEDTTLLKISADAVTSEVATLSFVELSEYAASIVTAQFARRPMDEDEARSVVKSLQISRDDGEITAYRFDTLPPDDRRRLLLETVERRWMPVLVHPLVDPRRQDVTTKAGRFEGCLAWSGVLPMRNVSDQAIEGWLHPTVPLAPVVQASSGNGKRSLELLDYGYGGPGGGEFL